MDLLRLTCQRFRCLEDVEFCPEPGINLIQGENAQGKTSLLEALLFVTTSKSHRTNIEADLVQHQADGFRVHAAVERRDRTVTLEVVWHRGVKRIRVNAVAQMRISDVLGKTNVVLFSPEDAALVSGTAAHRRRFLDMALAQLDHGYLDALQRYRHALRQRNEVLRQTASPDAGLLEVWDAQLARYGASLVTARAEFLGELASHAAGVYGRIADAEPLDVIYRPDVPPGDSLLDVLARTRDADIRRRVTSRGPHRDDFVFVVAGQPARSYASQGQQKTAALALKLAETALAEQRAGEYPILLLDEVFAELDRQRARRLLDAIGNEVQCLLTTTNPVPENTALGKTWPCYRIEGGRIGKG